ncbi:MAG: hypothetical protein V1784_03305 [bacterium]
MQPIAGRIVDHPENLLAIVIFQHYILSEPGAGFSSSRCSFPLATWFEAFLKKTLAFLRNIYYLWAARIATHESSWAEKF